MDEYNHMTIQEALNLDEIGKIINIMIDNNISKTVVLESTDGKKIYVDVDKNPITNKVRSVWISLVNCNNLYEHINIRKASNSLKSEIKKINPGDFNLGYDGPNLFIIEYINDRGLRILDNNFIVSNDFDVYNAKYDFLIHKDLFTDFRGGCTFKIISNKDFIFIDSENYQDCDFFKVHDYGDMSRLGVTENQYDRIWEACRMIDIHGKFVDICKNITFSKEEIECFISDVQENKDEFVKIYK